MPTVMGGPNRKDTKTTSREQRRRHDTIVSDSPLFSTLSQTMVDDPDSLSGAAPSFDTIAGGDEDVAAAIRRALEEADRKDQQDTALHEAPDLKFQTIAEGSSAFDTVAHDPEPPPKKKAKRKQRDTVSAAVLQDTKDPPPRPSLAQRTLPAKFSPPRSTSRPTTTLGSLPRKPSRPAPPAVEPPAPSAPAPAPEQKKKKKKPAPRKEASRTCPECERTFPASVNFCPRDGALLPPSALESGERIGMQIGDRILITGEVGTGAIGAVYRAAHKGLKTDVAVKLMHPVVSEDARAATRFLQEARLSSCLRHDNVVEVLEYGRTERNQLYIVMELLEGKTLRQIVREAGHLPPKRAVALICQILSGLQHAHDLGLVHRDMKPANVMVVYDHTQGAERVKVLDFGIAVDLSSMDRVATGTLCGTRAYLSPEQARGRPTDARSDIYAVGVMLFELLTGRPPFYDGTVAEIAVAHARQEPPRMAEVNGRAKVPPALEAVVMRALSKEPGRRPATAQQMANSLLAAVGDKSTPNAPTAQRPGAPAVAIPSAAELSAPEPAIPDVVPPQHEEPQIQPRKVEVMAVRGKNKGVGRRNPADRPVRYNVQTRLPRSPDRLEPAEMDPEEAEARRLLGLDAGDDPALELAVEPPPQTTSNLPELRSRAQKESRGESEEREERKRKLSRKAKKRAQRQEEQQRPRQRNGEPEPRRRYRPAGQRRPYPKLNEDRRAKVQPAERRPFDDGKGERARGPAPVVFNNGPLSRPGGIKAADRRVASRLRSKRMAQRIMAAIIALLSFSAVVMSNSKPTKAAENEPATAPTTAPDPGTPLPHMLTTEEDRPRPTAPAATPKAQPGPPPSNPNLAPAHIREDRAGMNSKRASDMLRAMDRGVEAPTLPPGLHTPPE